MVDHPYIIGFLNNLIVLGEYPLKLWSLASMVKLYTCMCMATHNMSVHQTHYYLTGSNVNVV